MATCLQKYNSKDKFDFSNLKKETGFIIDSNGYIIFIEESISKILGYSDTEIINKYYKNFLYDSNNTYELDIVPYCSKNIELTLRHKDGRNVYVQVSLEYMHNINMELVQFYGVITPIIKPNSYNKDINTISRIVENSRDVLYRFSVKEKKLVFLSRSVFQLLGYMSEEITNDLMTLFKNIHPEDLKRVNRKNSGNYDFSKPIVTRIRHRDGYYVCIEDFMTPFYDDNGNIQYIDGACRDITQKVEFEKRLEYLTFHDALTGLYNRNYFEEELNKLNTEVDIPISIVLCDLDNLKIVNDSLGHDNGDQMIIHVGKLLASLIDKNSFAARIGGDEFVIILKNKSLFDLKQFVTALISEISEYNKRLMDYTIQMSIGSSHNEHSLNNMQRLFKMADSQMYLNKSKRKAL